VSVVADSDERGPRHLAACQLDRVAASAQMFGDALPMVSLDQDDAVLHGASRAAASSQLARERVEGVAPRAQSVNHRHRLAVPA